MKVLIKLSRLAQVAW